MSKTLKELGLEAAKDDHVIVVVRVPRSRVNRVRGAMVAIGVKDGWDIVNASEEK